MAKHCLLHSSFQGKFALHLSNEDQNLENHGCLAMQLGKRKENKYPKNLILCKQYINATKQNINLIYQFIVSLKVC